MHCTNQLLRPCANARLVQRARHAQASHVGRSGGQADRCTAHAPDGLMPLATAPAGCPAGLLYYFCRSTGMSSAYTQSTGCQSAVLACLRPAGEATELGEPRPGPHGRFWLPTTPSPLGAELQQGTGTASEGELQQAPNATDKVIAALTTPLPMRQVALFAVVGALALAGGMWVMGVGPEDLASYKR